MTSAITWEAPDGDHPARRASRLSMTAVAAGRKDEWLALFTPDANGPSCANIAAITMWLGGDGTTMTVDGVMIYTVRDDGRITSIRGYWEPDRAMATITSP
ncbi:MAG: hypothetical protein JWM19_2786 [Actinomycetia bacterium]|nr:hypothetical protein [Actinomycetes bacterium]